MLKLVATLFSTVGSLLACLSVGDTSPGVTALSYSFKNLFYRGKKMESISRNLNIWSKGKHNFAMKNTGS